MTVQEFYAAIGGNYDEVLGRLRKEERIKKFAIMFLRDGSFAELKDFMAKGETQEAFRAAHTLKGVTQNLSLAKLYGSAHEITDVLRAGDLATAQTMLPQVEADYNMTIEQLKILKDS